MTKTFFLTAITFLGLQSCAQKDNSKMQKTESQSVSSTNSKLDTATLGTGCFWCTEAIFQQVKGVEKVTSGYSGGTVSNPSYEQVCSKTTGHAECLNIVYDSTKISYEELLKIFWQVHNPTTLNRQGNDIGTQYRSVIFYHNPQQKDIALRYKTELDKSGAWDAPIVTTLEKFEVFYPAENYHQNYYNNNTSQGYCQFVIKPKVEKFEKAFKDLLKKKN